MNKGSLTKWQQELNQQEQSTNQSGSTESDFRSPSVAQIADFLLHLFQDRKLQPGTIEGYRTDIADMVGNDKFNISKDEILTRLLDSLPRLLLNLCRRPLLNT